MLPVDVPRGTGANAREPCGRAHHALYTGNTKLAASSIVDHIAEPHRRHLLPGFDEASIELRRLGALSVGISGSGPTIFALVDDFEVARTAEAWMTANYQKNEQGFVHICRADLGGARTID